jgi:hypothetical protein
MQIFPPAEHQISNQEHKGSSRYQESRYHEFYSPVHLRFYLGVLWGGCASCLGSPRQSNTGRRRDAEEA